MSLSDYLGLSFSVILLGLSPGPGAFAIISRSLSDGFNKSLFIIFGIALSHIIYVLVTIYGLDYITSKFENLFLLVKYAGGLYLIYLGYKLWNKNMKFNSTDKSRDVSNRMNFMAGVMIAFSNPKAIIFYLGFLPAFINLKTLVFHEIVSVVFIVPLSLASVLIFYAFIASKAKKIMKTDIYVRRLNRISAFMMFTVGFLIMFK